VPVREGDYVFFVSLGQTQGDHVFDEGVSDEGVLTWQSQPRQGFDNTDIQRFMSHDEMINTIHLFMRNSRRGPYTYLGRLGYLSHDATRERPVHFQWQLLDWDQLGEGAAVWVDSPEGRGSVQRSQNQVAEPIVEERPGLKQRDVMPSKKARNQGVGGEEFRGRKVADYADRDARNRDLGLQGELLVLQHEVDYLVSIGRKDLSVLVRHVSVIEGDGAGYDVLSFGDAGQPKYIEVKTTRGGLDTDFYMSPNEIAFARYKGDSFSLYRVYNFDSRASRGDFYEIKGDPLDNFEAIPTGFRLTVK